MGSLPDGESDRTSGAAKAVKFLLLRRCFIAPPNVSSILPKIFNGVGAIVSSDLDTSRDDSISKIV